MSHSWTKNQLKVINMSILSGVYLTLFLSLINMTTYYIMKTVKRILLTAVALLSIVFINGCYYVYKGQFKSMDKIQNGGKLNLYECCSAYTMHMAIWIFGWTISPEAAEQAFLMHFVKDGKVVTRNNDFFYSSVVFEQQTTDKYKETYFTKQIHYPTSSFVVGNNELRYALAIDGGEYKIQWIDDGENIYPIEQISVLATYKPYTEVFNIGPLKINIDYRILMYLQEIGWLHTFTIIYEC